MGDGYLRTDRSLRSKNDTGNYSSKWIPFELKEGDIVYLVDINHAGTNPGKASAKLQVLLGHGVEKQTNLELNMGCALPSCDVLRPANNVRCRKYVPLLTYEKACSSAVANEIRRERYSLRRRSRWGITGVPYLYGRGFHHLNLFYQGLNLSSFADLDMLLGGENRPY